MLVGPVVTGWCLPLLCACKPISATLSDLLPPGTDCCGAAEFLGEGRVLVGCVPSHPLLWRFLANNLPLYTDEILLFFTHEFLNTMQLLHTVGFQEFLPYWSHGPLNLLHGNTLVQA